MLAGVSWDYLWLCGVIVLCGVVMGCCGGGVAVFVVALHIVVHEAMMVGVLGACVVVVLHLMLRGVSCFFLFVINFGYKSLYN